MTPEPLRSQSSPNKLKSFIPALCNFGTVILLVLGIFSLLPALIGLIAIWTIAPWKRGARIVVTAIFVWPAIYQLVLFGAFIRAAIR